MNLLRLADVDVRGKRVFIRADLNVPQDDAGRITDDTRIRASLPAIQDALSRGGAVMVTSHLGRPVEGKLTDADSLAPIAARLGELLGPRGPPDPRLGERRHVAQRARVRRLVMLENCRFNPGEKKDSDELAQQMAQLCDVYCNDAFGTAHRAEATTHAHGALRTDRLRRPAARRGARCARPRARRIRSGRWLRSSPARRCRRS